MGWWGDRERISLTKPGFTAEARRSQRKIVFLIQSGDGDWIRNSILLETGSNSLGGYDTSCDEPGIERTESFCFAGNLPAKQKNPSLRPLRLCGENVIWTGIEWLRRQ